MTESNHFMAGLILERTRQDRNKRYAESPGKSKPEGKKLKKRENVRRTKTLAATTGGRGGGGTTIQTLSRDLTRSTVGGHQRGKVVVTIR